MNPENFKKVWIACIKTIDAAEKLDQICNLYDVNHTDFIVWIAQDKLRKLKWIELQETRASQKEIKKLKRKDESS